MLRVSLSCVSDVRQGKRSERAAETCFLFARSARYDSFILYFVDPRIYEDANLEPIEKALATALQHNAAGAAAPGRAPEEISQGAGRHNSPRD